jgi:hypothetical protein
MVSFRKSFLLLALVVAVAAVASAQAFTCSFAGSPGVPARAEGLAEQMGDVVVSCTGGTPAKINEQLKTVNISVFLNVNVTSKVVSDPWTEVMLLIDEPAPAIQLACGDSGTSVDPVLGTCVVTSKNGNGQGDFDSSNTIAYLDTTGTPVGPFKRPNIWQGRCLPTGSCATGSASSITFLGVPVDPPGTGPARTLRIVNLRGNATMVPLSSFLPTPILAVLSVSNPGTLPLPQNTSQIVAQVQKGLAFSTASLPPGNGTDLKQCNPQYSNAPGNNSGNGRGCYQVRLRFQETFGTAFRLKGGDFQNNVADLNYNNNTESMFTNSNLKGRGGLASAGFATQATQFWARLSGIPAGVRLFASYSPISATGKPANSAGTAAVQAWLTSAATPYVPDPANGASSNIGISGSVGQTRGSGNADGACSTSSDGSAYNEGLNNSPYYEVGISASGTAAIAYTVGPNGVADSLINSIDIGLMVVYTTNPLPGLGSAQVTGNFAPISAADRMNDGGSLSFPRFIDTPITSTLFTVSTCKTNLLFTFMSNQAGFDTGIAISNTSLDPFKTAPQKGNCTLNYYGTFSSDATKTTYSQTSTSMVSGGQTLTATLSTGGTNGIAAVQGFQGYMIATCDFQFAHGYAYISNLGSTALAQGYMALIMDKPGIYRPDNSSEALAQ